MTAYRNAVTIVCQHTMTNTNVQLESGFESVFNFEKKKKEKQSCEADCFDSKHAEI